MKRRSKDKKTICKVEHPKKIIHKIISKHKPDKESSLTEISWKAPEWAYHSKGVIWWTGFFLLFCIALALSYYFHFWWGIVFAVLITATILVHSFKKPREILCKINRKGVKIGSRFYEWHEMISFWLVADMPYTLLYIHTINKLMPIISIEAPITKSEYIFKLLSKHLAIEDSHGEIIVDKFTRITRL